MSVATMRLTTAELAVLRAASEGERYHETAVRMHFSASHVSKLRASAAAKLGARNVTHAVAKAYRRGLLR
jgi:DNA-binding CsgD family transcriptional regulator